MRLVVLLRLRRRRIRSRMRLLRLGLNARHVFHNEFEGRGIFLVRCLCLFTIESKVFSATEV